MSNQAPAVTRVFQASVDPFKKAGKATEEGLRNIASGRFKEGGKQLGEAGLRGFTLTGNIGRLAEPSRAATTETLGFAGGQLQRVRTGAGDRATEGVSGPALPTQSELTERERIRRANEIRAGELRRGGRGRGQTILTRSQTLPSIIGG